MKIKTQDALLIATVCITLILSGYIIAVGLMNILANFTHC